MRYLGIAASFDDVLTDIGHRARELRLLRNLTQGDLARRSGVGSATIQRFEHRGQVSMENALRIAFALGAEEGFGRLFEPPKYATLDEALAQPKTKTRKRARKKK
jgi:transcriptional regulator with XRE-family HTH domain